MPSDPNCPRCKGIGERWTSGDLHRSAGIIPCDCSPPSPDPRDAKIAALEAEVARLKAMVSSPWDDKPLPEDDEIMAAHPMRSADPNTPARYAEAMRLVGARRGKYALIDLVNWLLAREAQLRADIGRLLDCAVYADTPDGPRYRGWNVTALTKFRLEISARAAIKEHDDADHR